MGTPFELPTFNGWTIDARLRQFRKVERGENPKIEFMDFDSEEGRALIEEMSAYFIEFFDKN